MIGGQSKVYLLLNFRVVTYGITEVDSYIAAPTLTLELANFVLK